MKPNIEKEKMTFDEAQEFLKKKRGRLLSYSEINLEAKMNKELKQLLIDSWVWTSDTDFNGKPELATVDYYGRDWVGLLADADYWGYGRVDYRAWVVWKPFLKVSSKDKK